MFDEIKDRIINIITSRITLISMIVVLLSGILVYRCFQLQIVKGEEYLNNFILQTEKTRDLTSTRGQIMDCNGEVLAYNELAYSVKIEDVFESGSKKNRQLNEICYRLIDMIEKNGDSVITDFKIFIDEDDEFAYSVDGTSRLRFLADIFGYATIDKLTEEEKAYTAAEIMAYLSRSSGKGTCFAIGDYETEGDKNSNFIPGKGYTKEDWLKMVTIRYAMNLTSYRKYIGTTVASNISEETVAVLMENADILPGVSIVEDTVRRYVDSKYFAHILGYTGKISSDELTELNAEAVASGGSNDTYNINDVVGKSGMEAYMETVLQGTKGSETVVVDTTGKVIAIKERTEAVSGSNVQLTIDMELTKAVYNIVEQKMAGLLSSKIMNAKEYRKGDNDDSSDIMIPIYDVYFAVINNSIVDIRHFTEENAGETEKAVYDIYLNYKDSVYNKLRHELTENFTPYNKLTREYQVYQSNIVQLLGDKGIIMRDVVDKDDATYIAWTTEEVISLAEYLKYCISQNWIDVSKLNLDDKYSDSAEIFSKLTDYIIEMVDNNIELQKRFYKYMLLNDELSGKDICKLICEQDAADVTPEEERALYDGNLTAYEFMMTRINNLDITPGQLALDPCNASVVITDVNTGEVKAIVSYPGYDNNKMANSVDAEYFARLNADKANSQYNFATQYSAAPGSTFKIVSAAAGYLENIVSLNEKVYCTGTFTEINPSPRCWKRTGHGAESLSTAITDSCNYYFYNVGYRLSTRTGIYDADTGLGKLQDYAELFGLTDKSGIEITEEAPKLSDIDPVRSAIGQGTNSFTTVGLARYVSTIANKGTCYQLSLLDKVVDSEGKILQDYDAEIRNIVELPDEFWNAAHVGMRRVVENKSYFSDLGVSVAGKTGTAEQTSSRPNHALFISYAPYEEPEISITTRIPFGYSSDYAAQVTRDIYKYYYGLAEEEDLITGTADTPDGGISNEM